MFLSLMVTASIVFSPRSYLYLEWRSPHGVTGNEGGNQDLCVCRAQRHAHQVHISGAVQCPAMQWQCHTMVISCNECVIQEHVSAEQCHAMK